MAILYQYRNPLIVIDEAALFGHFEELERSYTYGRSYYQSLANISNYLTLGRQSNKSSDLRDRARIQIELIDTETDATIDNTTLDLVGIWRTFGGLHPQDMVNKSVEDYFRQLFGLNEE